MKLSSPIYQLKRRAKLMARERGIALHEAQNLIAQAEGFSTWSLLASKAASGLAENLLDRAGSGELTLLAARPGHGKTIVGLQALIDARRAGRPAALFSLVMTEAEARQRLMEMGSEELAQSIRVETSDGIDADFIIAALADVEPGAVVVVDYLQSLDECRSKPELSEQIEKLRHFAAQKSVALIFLSQIDRTFETAQRKVPDVSDLRLPNPMPVEAFSKRVFLHDGEVRVDKRAV